MYLYLYWYLYYVRGTVHNINYDVAFPQIDNAPTCHNKTDTGETSAEHRDEATTRTTLAWLRRLDPAAKVGNVTSRRGGWGPIVQSQRTKAYSSPYPPNLPTNGFKVSDTIGQSTGSIVPSWLSAASLFVLYQKKEDQSQCIFSDPAHQQRNVLIPKLGQGYLAVSAPRELCTKRRVITAQTLSLAISLWETSLSQEPMVQCLHKGWEAVWKHDIDDFWTSGRLPNQHMESKDFWGCTHFAFQCPTLSGWLSFMCLPAWFTSNVIVKCTTLPHITTPDFECKHRFRQPQPQLWDKPVSQPVERSYQRSTSDLMQQSRHSCKVAVIPNAVQYIHANSTNMSQPFCMRHWCNLSIWFLPNS